ncbi:hypothetical protein [Anaerotruncus colihominis]
MAAYMKMIAKLSKNQLLNFAKLSNHPKLKNTSFIKPAPHHTTFAKNIDNLLNTKFRHAILLMRLRGELHKIKQE